MIKIMDIVSNTQVEIMHLNLKLLLACSCWNLPHVSIGMPPPYAIDDVITKNVPIPKSKSG